MRIGLKPILLVALVVIASPVAYTLARSSYLSRGFADVELGDPIEVVREHMGSPKSEGRANLYLDADVEYYYYVWPIPTVWVVGFRNSKVAGKLEMNSP